MQVVYICSPYGTHDKAVIKQHKKYAKEITKLAIDCGLAPITPHLYLLKILDDNKKTDRHIREITGLTLVGKCDAVLYGSRYGISERMESEIKEARAKGIPCIDIEDKDKLRHFLDGRKLFL